jgi:hypothetical protein
MLRLEPTHELRSGMISDFRLDHYK